jgi:UDP-GlcNAc:undecaprenyl-phosphate GlcNAc-1-phosphate transferase
MDGCAVALTTIHLDYQDRPLARNPIDLNTFLTFRVIFIAALLSLVLGPLGFFLTSKLGLIDDPDRAPHKKHRSPVPVAGGLVLFTTVSIVLLLEGVLRHSDLYPIMGGSIVILLFGLLDDFKDLSPLSKIAGQLLATVLLIALGVQVNLFYQNWLNVGLTILWVVGVTNAYNFVDSMDGLAIGLSGVAFAFFMFVTIESLQFELSLFSTVLLGACLGAYYYNTSPAYFYLGDSGSQFLGFVLASLAIAYNPVGFSRFASWYVPILLVGVPLFDTALVVVSRLRRKRPVYRAATDHTYHRLVSLGLNSTRAVLTMQTVALLLGCLAFIALDLPPLISNWIFAMVLSLGAITLLILDSKKVWP